MKPILHSTQTTLLVLFLFFFCTGTLVANELHLTAEEIQQFAAEVSKATGRTFQTIPEIEIVTDDALQQIYYQEQDLLDEIYRDQGDTNFYRSWLTGIFLGKYSWLTGKIYLVKENMEHHSQQLAIDFRTMEKLVILHELVHALDDQSYDLKITLSKALNQENTMAIASMIEGHAMYYSQLVYEKLNLDQNAIESLWRLDSRQYNYLGMLYAKGFEFIQYIFQHSILSGTELFANPPLQTRMILEPQAYLENEGVVELSLEERLNPALNADIPLYFQFATDRSIDKLTMLMGLNALGADESILDGYKSGYTYQFYEILKAKPEYQIPLTITDLMNWDKGFMVITITEFDSETHARSFWEYCKENNQLQWSETDSTVKQKNSQFAHLLSAYTPSFLNVRDTSPLGTLFYFLPLLQSHYVIEFVALNIPITEKHVTQILQAIEQRL